jgi:hypothetical protein
VTTQMPDPDVDPQLESRIRRSFKASVLPPAPDVLLDQAARLARNGSSKVWWVSFRWLPVALIVVIGVVAVSFYRSTQPRLPSVGASSSPAASPTADATPSFTESQIPTPVPQTPVPSLPEMRRPEPTAPAVQPAADDVLALAGRGRVPGLLYCGHGLAFKVDALDNPAGAEELLGPEYDALREVLDEYVALGAPELGPHPTAREVARDSTGVLFLIEHAGSMQAPGGGLPVVPIQVDQIGGQWAADYDVDCQPRAVLPPGYERATWRIDPAHSAPTARTRALHVLVEEHACSSGRSPAGRIGPAYLVVSRFEMAIEIIVKKRPGDQVCLGAPPVKARLSLPEAIEDRFLRDVNDYLHNQSGG